MAEKHGHVATEVSQAPPVRSATQAEPQALEHLEGAWDEPRSQARRAASAFGAGQQSRPASGFDAALGRVKGSAAMRAELVMQLQRRLGNSAMSRLIQRRASGDADASDARAASNNTRTDDARTTSRDILKDGARALPEGFASTIEGAGVGSPLDDPTRLFMEGRFGLSFEDVRIHSDSRSAEAARQVSARAFTAGRDIYFGRGLFQPHTADGKQLLAHELTHVVQQRDGRAAVADEAHALSLPEDDFELEAEGAAAGVASGRRVSVSHGPRGFVARDKPSDASGGASSNTSTNSGANAQGGMTGKNASTEVAPEGPNQSPAGQMDADRLEQIRKIHANTWVGPLDEYELERIWNSFGSDLPAVAEANWALWEESVNYGAELYDIPAVKAVREKFAEDVRETARQYLFVNRDYVRDEMAKLGISENDARAPVTPTPEQDKALQEVQQAADKVEKAQQQRQRLSELWVGYDVPRMSEKKHGAAAVKFDPRFKPYAKPEGNEDPPMPSWEETKEQYDSLTNVINGLASRYPAIYALTRSEKVKDVLNDDPAQARSVIQGVMKEVLANVEDAFGKLVPGGAIEYYDLQPIHAQLFGGTGAPSGTPWGRQFYKKVANEDLEGHSAREFWVSMGLSAIAAIALVAAEIATFGSATFFIAAGAGVVASGLQAGLSWNHYLNIAQAAGTNVTDETALVSSGQASGALIEAIINTAAFFLDLYGPVTKGFKTAAKVAEEGAEVLGKREALEAGKKELAELASAEVAERKSVGELSRGTAEAIEGAGTLGSKSFAKVVRELFTEVINNVKTWARRAYEAFGFKSYVVEIEGDRLVLYGIRSKIKLLECRINYLNEYTFQNRGQLANKVLEREELLAEARAATDKVLANATRRSAIELSEDIGEIAAERALRKHLKLAGSGALKRLHRGSGKGTLDLIYKLGDGSFVVIEAKGGAGKVGTRAIEPGLRSKQGTWEYLESILISMGDKGQEKLADEVMEAMEKGKVQYYFVETPIKEGEDALTTSISKFDFDY
jgi:Domain of unknown function (DUF4157)